MVSFKMPSNIPFDSSFFLLCLCTALLGKDCFFSLINKVFKSIRVVNAHFGKFKPLYYLTVFING